MRHMKQTVKYPFSVLVIVASMALPLSAEDQSVPENPELSEGAELLNRGFQLLLEGLSKEIEPMAPIPRLRCYQMVTLS